MKIFIMKIYVICCVPAQVLLLVKILYLRYCSWAKVLSANQISGFLNQLFLQNNLMKQPQFLHFNTNSQKLKVRNFFSWAWSNYGCGQSGPWTLIAPLASVIMTHCVRKSICDSSFIVIPQYQQVILFLNPKQFI